MAHWCKKTCNKCDTTAVTTPQPMGNSLTPHPTCGYSAVPQSRIVNGFNAKEGA